MSSLNEARNLRVIVSGGGTGGHIFPAIAIADELKRLRPNTEFLFVGAKGRMEMEKVPAAGYPIEGLWISGLQRRLTLDNLNFPFKVISSVWKSRQILRRFKPDVVVGTGGYAGGPILYAAAKMGIPTLIQEPNAFAGLANKWVGKHVDKVCVAFPGMEKFFPSEKLVITGNPVREALLNRVLEGNFTGAEQLNDSQRNQDQKTDISSSDSDLKPVYSHSILLMGGSGGARTLNRAMKASTNAIAARPNVFWTWQCGKYYYEDFKDCATAQLPNVHVAAFLDHMDQEYAKADVVIGRAGSTTIAEIEYLGKPAVLVPSPWVAEDHQTKNAEALVAQNAAVLLADADAEEQLVSTVLGLIDDPNQRERLGANAKKMAQPGAVTRIAQEVLRLIGKEQQSTLEGLVRSGSNLADASRPGRQVYFIGIGGIGMSALARYYNSRGYKVGGYDRTATDLTKALEAEGITVHYTPQPEALPTEEGTLFVYTPAVPKIFPELVALRAKGKKVYKRSEVLGMISQDKETVAIAGTHGKTTTTTLTTHLMRASGVDASAFLGGISKNFNTNYVHGDSQWVIAEADEYDRSFLRLFPKLAVILSMDADHLDIYGDHQTMLETGFMAFAQQVTSNGTLIVKHDLLPHFSDLTTTVKSFGIEVGDYSATNIRVEDGMFTFDLDRSDAPPLLGLRLPLPGRHNVENATAAIALTLEAGGDVAAIDQALLDFKGIGRRFETVLRKEDCVIIDDYAHHPTELTAAITAARELYPGKLIRGVFQPHLYSRTRDFAAGFAQALDLLDDAILLPIYPAREEPIAGVTSKMLLELMTNENKQLVEKTALIGALEAKSTDVLLILGAGDIDALVPEVVAHYEKMIQA
ncbi:MAG: UDP-N-acetylmuramate--L-alanine ligase [Bacteroidota bacterium]